MKAIVVDIVVSFHDTTSGRSLAMELRSVLRRSSGDVPENRRGLKDRKRVASLMGL